ncbi:MAG TPA: pyruvate kinase [Cytophagales bacterium]|jgi:pyruvate kinase|nr:pyruvate kinase [Cytophagales bacterium]
MDRNHNKTKIVATVGPACETKSRLANLIKSGANVFRLNFSHGTHAEHANRIKSIRELNEELNTHISILQDLQGPKIRIAEVEQGAVTLKVGQKLVITTEQVLGTKERVSTSYKSLPKDVKIGDSILIDDGNLEMKVVDKNTKEVFTQVLHGGILKSRKGINLPTSNVSAPSLTPKDMEDLMFGIEMDVDWIALSFVRSAKDIIELKKIIESHGRQIKVVAKIEKPEAVANFDEIVKVTDAVMVARGDLGVEIPMEEVPVVQKELVYKCNQSAKPVIVATQMVESMVNNPRPTRAEASDVANAIMDGADAVMLSAETASGSFPALAVRSMAKIIRSVESKVMRIYNKDYEMDTHSETYKNDRVLASAISLAEDTNARAITGMTFSGYTATGLSRFRPQANIYIFTGNEKLLNQLNLIWGVRGFFYDKFYSTDDSLDDVLHLLHEKRLIKKGDVLVNTSTSPVKPKKRTNTVRLMEVE